MGKNIQINSILNVAGFSTGNLASGNPLSALNSFALNSEETSKQ